MRRDLVLFLFLSCIAGALYAQKVKSVSGSYLYYVPETMTIQEAKQEALRRAQIDALAAEFGTTVSQSTAVHMSQKSESFYQEGAALVKGEWIETVGEPEFERGFHGDDMYIRCTVKGRARAIKSSKADLGVKVLRNGTGVRYEASEFADGDKIYLHFNSPVDGYLAVFLHDTENDVVSCLLPYRRDNIPAVKVEGDEDYVFFSKQMNTLGLRAQEYVMGCANEHETNTLYVVFSRNEFVKPSLDDGRQKSELKHMNLEDFTSWLSRSQVRDKDMQVEKRIISLTNQ